MWPFFIPGSGLGISLIYQFILSKQNILHKIKELTKIKTVRLEKVFKLHEKDKEKDLEDTDFEVRLWKV